MVRVWLGVRMSVNLGLLRVSSKAILYFFILIEKIMSRLCRIWNQDSLKYDYKRILIRMNNYIKNTNEDEFYQI